MKKYLPIRDAVVEEYEGRNDIAFVSLAAGQKADLVKLLQNNPFKIPKRTGRDRYDPQQIRHAR